MKQEEEEEKKTNTATQTTIIIDTHQLKFEQRRSVRKGKEWDVSRESRNTHNLVMSCVRADQTKGFSLLGSVGWEPEIVFFSNKKKFLLFFI
jgi:hypothetical protein